MLNRRRFLSLIVALIFISNLLCAQQSPQAGEPMYGETMGVLAKVESTNNYAGSFNPDSANTLPFGNQKEI